MLPAAAARHRRAGDRARLALKNRPCLEQSVTCSELWCWTTYSNGNAFIVASAGKASAPCPTTTVMVGCCVAAVEAPLSMSVRPAIPCEDLRDLGLHPSALTCCENHDVHVV